MNAATETHLTEMEMQAPMLLTDSAANKVKRRTPGIFFDVDDLGAS